MHIIMIGGSSVLKIMSVLKQSADDLEVSSYPNMRAFLDTASQRSLTFERLILLEDGYASLGNSAQAILSQFLSFMSNSYPSIPIIALGQRNQEMLDLSLALSAAISLTLDAAKISPAIIVNIVTQPLESLKSLYSSRVIDPIQTDEVQQEVEPSKPAVSKPEKHGLCGRKNKNIVKAGTSTATPLNTQDGVTNSDLDTPPANVNPFAEGQADNINPFAESQANVNPFADAQASNMGTFSESIAPDAKTPTQKKEKHGLFGRKNKKPSDAKVQQNINPFSANEPEPQQNVNPFNTPAPEAQQNINPFNTSTPEAQQNINPFNTPAPEAQQNINPFDTPAPEAQQNTSPFNSPEPEPQQNINPFNTPAPTPEVQVAEAKENEDVFNTPAFEPQQNINPFNDSFPESDADTDVNIPQNLISDEQKVVDKQTGTVSDEVSEVEDVDSLLNAPLAASPLDNFSRQTPVSDFSANRTEPNLPPRTPFFEAQGHENKGSFDEVQEAQIPAQNPIFQPYTDENTTQVAPIPNSSKNQNAILANGEQGNITPKIKSDFDEISPVPAPLDIFSDIADMGTVPTRQTQRQSLKAEANVDNYSFAQAVSNLPNRTNHTDIQIEETESSGISFVDDTRYNQQFAPTPRVVEKIVEKEVYISASAGTPAAKLLELNQQVTVFVTGDRRSGVTYTALNLASLYGKRISTLVVDLDTETYGGQLYQDLSYLCSEEENVQNGLTRLRSVNMLQNLVMHDSDSGYDYLFSLIGNQKPSEENYKNIQSVLLAQKYYQLTIIDCPWDKLKYFTELISRSKVLICVEPDITGCHNIIELLNAIPASSRLSQVLERNGAFVSKLGTAPDSLLTNMTWIGDTFNIDIDNGDTPWHTLRVLGSADRANLIDVMKKL